MRYLMMTLCLLLAFAAQAMTPADWLAAQPQPVFRPGHSLPLLGTWGQNMDVNTSTLLAGKWGYALETVWAVQGDVDTAKKWPLSRQGLIVANAIKTGLPASVFLSGNTHAINTELPAETWLCTAAGVPQVGLWSPLAPDASMRLIATRAAARVKELQVMGVNVKLILNGGEWGLGCYANYGTSLLADAKVNAAYTASGLNIYQFLSLHKARLEAIMADELRKVAPQAQYVYYSNGGSNQRLRYGNWWQYEWTIEYMKGIGTNYPASILYYNHYNDGWVDNAVYHDLLEMTLGAKGFELANGLPFSYNWLCGGWTRTGQTDATEPAVSDPERYVGFLKSMLVTGQLGGVAGYFAYEMNDDVDPANPPAWLTQRVALGHVQALASWLEPIVRTSDLMAGPTKHRWSGYPGGEFPTPYPEVHVLARKVRNKDIYLIAAWSADGTMRDVTVKIGGLGAVSLRPRACGSVYVARLLGGVVDLRLVDGNGMAPTLPYTETQIVQEERTIVTLVDVEKEVTVTPDYSYISEWVATP